MRQGNFLPHFFLNPMKNATLKCLLVITGIAFCSCKQKVNTLFVRVDPTESNIDFSNDINETDTFNILTHEYIYNGGGVGVGDFDNDGLQDVFFTGNTVSNKLYRNKGSFQFEDITAAAGVDGKGQWCSGVAVVDINTDGWLDLYVCSTFHSDSTRRRNLLYVNQGKNDNGQIVFEERAKEFGIDDDGYTTNAAFFDYDNDGDQDLYVLSNILNEKIPTVYRKKISDGSAINNDRLYRNNGNGTFTNVTIEAGIRYEGYGLGLAIADYNQDGWSDIYVSNDYLSNDILYINQRNGTFENKTAGSVKHHSMFSMGNDAADFNNDGRVDILTLDMLGETNFRQKTTMGNKNYLTYINNEKYGYEYQYIRNMLQMNNGVDATGALTFSEIGLMAGIYRTDWSWSPLFADVDNDGNKDLLITNGFPKDITDRDFANYRSATQNLATARTLLDSIPAAKVPNYAFKNNGDLTFSDVSKEWGLAIPSFSNGAAFADLDNDGDLDYVVNNIDDKAFVFRNTLNESQADTTNANHFFRIQLEGPKGNPAALGTKVTLYYNDGKKQFHEHSLYRGYLSSVENAVHFGLGRSSKIDSLLVHWPDGRQSKHIAPAVDTVLKIAHDPSADRLQQVQHESSQKASYLKEVSAELGIVYKHEEDDIIDFNFQRTLPHKFSQLGPAISVGDINNDGLEDFVIGASSGKLRTFYVQGSNGKFTKKPDINTKAEEDEGLLLFDADNDGDLDLYAVSGSLEHGATSQRNADKLYRNDGKGNFKHDPVALPIVLSSGSCVRAADFDKDGDLDLFVGGRISLEGYPLPGKSQLLVNQDGRFEDHTRTVCAEIDSVGMVTDALWTDYDNNGTWDLIVAGEFMALQIFKNENGTLRRQNDTGLELKIGWWNSISAGDFDRDGDTDYIAGNLGQNNYFHASEKYPLRLIAKDFDNNGSIDPILSCYFKETLESDERKLFPVHFWDELNSQSPKFRQQFLNFKQYARATTESLLNKDDLKNANVIDANYFQTSYIENAGNGKFVIRALPASVQVAPVNGIVVDDFNDDGFADVMITGNDFGNEIFIGRYDAGQGSILTGDGKGNFSLMDMQQSGFSVGGDAKAATKMLSGTGQALYLVSQNRDSLKAFRNDLRLHHTLKLGIEDMWIMASCSDGRQQKIEAYLGSGYLSQSSVRVTVPIDADSVTVVDKDLRSRPGSVKKLLTAKK